MKLFYSLIFCTMFLFLCACGQTTPVSGSNSGATSSIPSSSSVESSAESNPNDASIFALWQQLDGYWLNVQNKHLITFLINQETGFPQFQQGLWESDLVFSGKATQVNAVDKTCFFFSAYCPKPDPALEGPQLAEQTVEYTIDVSLLSEGEITLKNAQGNTETYQFSGKTYEEAAKFYDQLAAQKSSSK